MAYDYGRLAQTATRLIDRFGRDATLTKLSTAGGYDPGDPSEASYPVRVVADNYSQRERDGTLIQANDRRYYLTSAVAPESQDVIEDGAERLVIVNVEDTRPGPTAVMYTLQVRA
jgi:hypothetical protein